MTDLPLARRRLHAHHLASARFATPAEAVAWMGALQAQEYLAVRWAVGLRCQGATEASVEQAVSKGQLIRTWAMRGTLQLIAAADSRWLMDLIGPAMLSGSAAAYRKQGVDAAAFVPIERDLGKILRGGEALTRAEVFAALEQHGHATTGQRGYYILARAGQMGRLCVGPLRGKQETYTLLDDWAPAGRSLPRDAALAELARRYFNSHGPATLADFTWWSGLPLSQTRAALEMVAAELAEERHGVHVYWGPAQRAPTTARGATLLPAFDEFILGYTDRTAPLAAAHSPRVMSNNGIFYPTIVHNGEVLGTWKRTLKKSAVVVTLSPFAPLKPVQRKAVEAAAERYGDFVGLRAEMGYAEK